MTNTPVTAPKGELRERSLKAFELPGILMEIEEALWELHETEGPDAAVPKDLQARIDKFCEDGPVAILKVYRAIFAINKEAEACKEMADNLAARAKMKAATVDNLKGMLLTVIDTAFQGKVRLEGLTAWGQDQPSEAVIYESADPFRQAEAVKALPGDLKVVEEKPKIAAIKAAIKAGNAVPGFAIQKSNTRTLRFKV